MQLPSSVTGSIHLDTVDCCVFWHAVTRQSQLASRWGEFGGRYKLIQSVFMTSLSLSFVPSDEAAAMYRSIAQAELKRLSGQSNNTLACRHGRETHIKALRDILRRMPVPVLH